MGSNKNEISLLANVGQASSFKGISPFQEGDNKSGSLLMRSGQAPTRTEKSSASGQDPNRHCYSMLGQCI